MIPEISWKMLVCYTRGRASAELGAETRASPAARAALRAAPLSGAVGNAAGRANTALESQGCKSRSNPLETEQFTICMCTEGVSTVLEAAADSQLQKMQTLPSDSSVSFLCICFWNKTEDF